MKKPAPRKTGLVDATAKYAGKGLLFSPDPLRCPHCSSEDIKPILYGLYMEEEYLKGYHPGGCMPKDERWHCADCGNDF